MADEDDLLDSDWREPDHPITAQELREIIDEHKELIRWSAPAQLIFTIIGIWVIIAVTSSVWQSKLRYVIWYGVDWSSVSIANKPHDCGWQQYQHHLFRAKGAGRRP